MTVDIGLAAESLLNDALDEDTLDDSYVSKAILVLPLN
jgi:hypothetical protein